MQGELGDSGDQGPTGDQGPKGGSGPQGAHGESGETGAQVRNHQVAFCSSVLHNICKMITSMMKTAGY